MTADGGPALIAQQVVVGGAVAVLAASLVVLACLLALVLRWLRAEQAHRRHLETVTSAMTRLSAGEDVGGLDRRTFGGLADAMQRLAADRRTWLAVAQSESGRLTLVLDALAEGVLACDGAQRLVLINRAGRALLRLPEPSPARAAGPGLVLAGVLRVPSVLADVRATLTTGEGRAGEFELPGPARRRVTYDVRPLPPPGGAAVVLRDVTDLRRLEELRHEFIANVSHELKTPLSAIKGYAETLRMWEAGPSERTTAYAARIEEQADRLYKLILDMLQIGRIESGAEVFHPEPVVVADVVDVAVEQRRDRAAARQVTLAVEPGPEEAGLTIDAEALLTILTNLIDNALNATPPGGRVTVAWSRSPRPAEAGEASPVAGGPEPGVVLTVADTGHGIPPEHRARIFERFYRVDPARSRQQGGTGLGLAIVKNLAQTFGGTVTVESAVGVGSTFTVRLPRGGEPEGPAAAATPPVP